MIKNKNKKKKEKKAIPLSQVEEKVGVMWTRVSTQEQALKGMSLETQRQACEDYARRNNIRIVEHYGGTHESAKQEGKLFREMIDSVAKRTDVNMILCYTLDRFARTGPEGIMIKEFLQSRGIYVISVTQGIDPESLTGGLFGDMLLLFAKFDNDQRKMKCMAGMRESLRAGKWYSKPPLGYDKIGNGKNRMMVVNDTGRLLREAFKWKAEEGITDVEVCNRLKARGLKIDKQRISEIFHNKFYCGYIEHALLDEGEVVKGNQEILIDEETFNKVNNIPTHKDYTHAEETPDFPLKRHIRCADCGGYLTGYNATKRKTKYYKCNKKGCRHNYRIEVLHDKYRALLDGLEIPKELYPIIKKVLTKVYTERNNYQIDTRKALLKRKSELCSELENVEYRAGTGKIPMNVYETTYKRLHKELEDVEAGLNRVAQDYSNILKFTDDALAMCCNLRGLWERGDFSTRQRLQKIAFPEGVTYDDVLGDYRTPKTNEVFELFGLISGSYDFDKSKKEEKSSDFSSKVAGGGLEPPTSGL